MAVPQITAAGIMVRLEKALDRHEHIYSAIARKAFLVRRYCEITNDSPANATIFVDSYFPEIELEIQRKAAEKKAEGKCD